MTKIKWLSPWRPVLALCAVGLILLLFPSIRFCAYLVFCIALLALCYRLLEIFHSRKRRFCLYCLRLSDRSGSRCQRHSAVFVPAQTHWLSLRVNYFLREIAGVWYYMIFGG